MVWLLYGVILGDSSGSGGFRRRFGRRNQRAFFGRRINHARSDGGDDRRIGRGSKLLEHRAAQSVGFGTGRESCGNINRQPQLGGLGTDFGDLCSLGADAVHRQVVRQGRCGRCRSPGLNDGCGLCFGRGRLRGGRIRGRRVLQIALRIIHRSIATGAAGAAVHSVFLGVVMVVVLSWE